MKRPSWSEYLGSIRARPAMYVGSTGASGLHSLFAEILENSIEEAVGGRASAVEVTLHTDGSLSVTDNGGGIEPDSIEDIFTTHTTQRSPRYARGMMELGVLAVNALSEWLEVTTVNGPKLRSLRYEQGRLVADKTSEHARGESGLRVRFLPDPTIFDQDCCFLPVFLSNRLRTLSFLVPGLQLTLRNEATGALTQYQNNQGLRELVETFNVGNGGGHTTVTLSSRTPEMHIDLALQLRVGSELVVSFVNHSKTWGGGHVTGLRKGALAGINEWLRSDHPLGGGRVGARDLGRRICAVVSVRLPHVQWEGACRERIGNPEVRPAVEQAVREAVVAAARQHPAEWQHLMRSFRRGGAPTVNL